MSIDRAKNDYFVIEGLANVLYEHDKNQPPHTGPYVINQRLAPVIKRVAVARPEWTLIGANASGSNVNRFIVWDGAEQLGAIHIEYQNSGYGYAVTNSRIRGKLERGSYRFTKDMNKALKLIYANFAPNSPDEAMAVANNKVRSELLQMDMNARNQWTRLRDQTAGEGITGFLLANWDALLVHLEGCALNSGVMDACRKGPELHEKWQQLDATEVQYREGKGTLILLRGGKYVTLRKSVSENPVVVDTLREELRAGMGMLKLVGDKTHLPGIGYRQDATTFFLMETPED